MIRKFTDIERLQRVDLDRFAKEIGR